MSFAAVAKVARITTGDDKSKSVLFWLAFHLNEETGLCCPSIGLLRKETEVGSENTIRSALTRLRERGLVSWTREIENGAVKRTLYTLHLDTSTDAPTSAIEPTSATEVPQQLKGGTSMVDVGYLNGCRGVPQPLKGNMEIEHRKEHRNKQGSVLPAPLEAETPCVDTNPNPPSLSAEDVPPLDDEPEGLFEPEADLPEADPDLPVIATEAQPGPESEEGKPKRKRKSPAKKVADWPVEDDGVDAETREAYLAVRKAKRVGPFTRKAYEQLAKKAQQHGVSVKVALEKCIGHGWVFPYDGAFETEKNHGKTQQSQQKSAFLRPQSEIDYTYGLDRWNRA